MDERYRKIDANSKILTDALGSKIDEGVRELVVLLNYNKIGTIMSCWGHKKWGFPYPWIDIELEHLDKLHYLVRDLNIDVIVHKDSIRIQPKIITRSLIHNRYEFVKLKNKLKKIIGN